jgi:hypothetical protein
VVKQCGADSGNIRLVVAEIALTALRRRAAVRKISPLSIKCLDAMRSPILNPSMHRHSNSTALSSRVVKVDPPLIPDLLALVGDAADGYPGIPGIGASTAAQLLNRYGQIEKFPSNVLGEQRDLALLFKNLPTLRTHTPLF